MGIGEHKKDAGKNLRIGVISVSTTRTLGDDESGHWIREEAVNRGHKTVFHQVVPDDIEAIHRTVLQAIREKTPHALIITGGTGISKKDVTIEALSPHFEKELTAFGPIFAQQSYREVGSPALLSRATAGIMENTAVFCIPGSLGACRLACSSLIFPEVGHVVKHLGE